MVSHKPRSAVSRLPLDFEKPRIERQLNPAERFVPDLGPLVNTSEATRWKAMQAVTCATGKGDLEPGGVLEVVLALGLDVLHAQPEPAAVKALRPPRPIDYRCPQCTQPPGHRCVSKFGIETVFHKARKQLNGQEEAA